ncbi:uncharacterized protein YbjT (DUF2867 family) [Stackebrandtia endophytica]|uniref:Uncharacterized protein YbjT (DUF2867 family) n=1 Tax=Stackebrandtia endophytica TaxID=1496996 RepID=A0A543B0W0_9ACTN|nr:NAD(P)H-binding protein [Stackebrandtia endophytica]TQL78426.1 uncharacterized protein YbjT (DUF2867 family) [Stackebrandtia endophytica]
MIYLVAGATGTVGRHVVQTLHEAGHEVRALTRDPAKATFPDGVSAIAGDLSTLDAVIPALDGVVGVHLVNFGGGENYGPLENGVELVRAMESAGVRKVSMLAGWNESTLESAVWDSGLEWAQVLPTAFMSNSFDHADKIRGGEVRAPFVDVKTADVHEGDIGAVCAHVLMDEGHGGAKYGLTGPQRLSLREKIDIFGEALGRDIRLIEQTAEEARVSMSQEGVPADMIEFLLEVFSAPPVEANTVNDNVEKVTGRPARSFVEWVTEHADRF